MGLLAKEDWRCEWISVETDIEKEDREVGIKLWSHPREPESPSDICYFRHRLQIEMDCNGVLLIEGAPRLDGIWLDGELLEIACPQPLGFSTTPLTEISLSLSAGEHCVAVQLSRRRPSGRGHFAIGGLIRLISKAGDKIERKSLDNWKNSHAIEEAWSAVDFDDKRWPECIAISRTNNIPWPAGPAIYLRHEFDCYQKPDSARLYLSVLGAAETYINGSRAESTILSPGYTDFRKRIPYHVQDVTLYLKSGRNCIGFLVGDGWYASALAPGSRYPFGDAPRRIRAQLEVSFPDGSSTTIITNPEWHMATSAILSSDIYGGERYDARLDRKGWSDVGVDVEEWKLVDRCPSPPGNVSVDLAPPIRITGIVDAVDVVEVDPGVWRFDFGQNCTAVPELQVSESPGTRITIVHGENLDLTGRVDQSSLRAAGARDVYVCAGSKEAELYQPRFTFHGFRYAEVGGTTEGVRPNLRAKVLGSDLDLIGKLETGSELVQRIWDAAIRSIRSNYVGVPLDCPQRDERLGWLGDAQASWEAASFSMNLEAFGRRFLEDVRVAQYDDGAIPAFAPTAARRNRGSTPGWADAAISIPRMVWWFSGRTAVIDENWECMVRLLSSISRNNPGYIWENDRGLDLGDWSSIETESPAACLLEREIIATALWARACSCMCEMASATSRQDAEAYYLGQYERIRAAFQSRFLGAGGKIGGGTQASYVAALKFGLLDDGQREQAASHLAAAVERRGRTLTTGYVTTPHLLDVLAETGHEELAVAVLQQSNFPSWGYMIERGATTFWERWDADSALTAKASLNHHALASVGAFIFRRLVGIEAAAPGFRIIRVHPIFSKEVGSASGSFESPMGRIAVAWRYRTARRVELSTELPANSTAEICVPRGAYVFDANGTLDNWDNTSGCGGADARMILRGGGANKFYFDLSPGTNQVGYADGC